MRISPSSTLRVWATGTRLPRRMPLRSQTAARRLVMSGWAASQAIELLRVHDFLQ